MMVWWPSACPFYALYIGCKQHIHNPQKAPFHGPSSRSNLSESIHIFSPLEHHSKCIIRLVEWAMKSIANATKIALTCHKIWIHLFVGANQLLWYYADLEKQRCYDNQHKGFEVQDAAAVLLPGNISIANITGNANPIQVDINHCLAWRRFAK